MHDLELCLLLKGDRQRVQKVHQLRLLAALHHALLLQVPLREGLVHETGELGASGAEKVDVAVAIAGMDVVVVDAGEIKAREACMPFVEGLIAADFAANPEDVEHLFVHPEVVLLDGLGVGGEVLVDDFEVLDAGVVLVEQLHLPVIGLLDLRHRAEPLEPFLGFGTLEQLKVLQHHLANWLFQPITALAASAIFYKNVVGLEIDQI